MAGIRGHGPLEALPVILVIVVGLFLSLRNRPNGGWIALALATVVVGLFLIGYAVGEITSRMRRGYLVMLRGETSKEQAASLARRIVNTRTDTYSLALQDTPSFFEAARAKTDVARYRRQVVFRHAPWT